MKAPSDIGDRIERLIAVLAEHEWDAIIASLPESILYLSGALIQTQQLMRRRQCAVVLTRDGAATLVVAEVELPLAQRMVGDMPVRTYKELTESACSVAADILREQDHPLGTVAIERSYLPVVDCDVLASALPKTRIVACDTELMALRRVKSSVELEELHRAAQVIDQAIVQAVSDARPGMREDALAYLIRSNIQKLGGGSVALATGMVASGSNLLVPHHHAGDRSLQEGDTVKVAGRATFHGYYGQLARMATVGTGAPAFLDRYARSCEVHRHLLSELKPGIPASEIYQKMAAKRESLGLGGRLSHVGHSMGLEYMESPKLAPGASEPLELGMVMQATTVTNDATDGLIQIVDMVAIDKHGARLLSNIADTAKPLAINGK